MGNAANPRVRLSLGSLGRRPVGEPFGSIAPGTGNEPIVYIYIYNDEHAFSWREFGRFLTTYAGWGMRVIFVPDDEIDLEPRIEVREPGEDER